LGRRRLGLDGREHGSTLDWHGAKQACQHQPSNDVADAPSMCVIVLNPHSKRIVFDTVEWHFRLEQLAEMRRRTLTSARHDNAEGILAGSRET